MLATVLTFARSGEAYDSYGKSVSIKDYIGKTGKVIGRQLADFGNNHTYLVDFGNVILWLAHYDELFDEEKGEEVRVNCLSFSDQVPSLSELFMSRNMHCIECKYDWNGAVSCLCNVHLNEKMDEVERLLIEQVIEGEKLEKAMADWCRRLSQSGLFPQLFGLSIPIYPLTQEYFP